MSRIKYCRLIFVFLLVAVQLIGKAQLHTAAKEALDSAPQNALEEKIFIHTDKESYLAGELLWFKVYNVDGLSNRPLNVSKLAYVEIIDQNNNPVLQAKIALKNGTGSGSLYVPLTITNGTYKLRAYTNWMKNFGADTFFEKQLKLINTLSSPNLESTNKPASDLQFFAEGGDLVEGIAANVAFKAVDVNGKGIDLKGVIVNQKNDTVARFQTLKFGIGQFAFTPLPNTNYKAIAIATNKEIIIKELPAIKKQGYSLLLVDGESETFTLKVSTNLSVAKVNLVIHNGKQVAFAEMKNVADGKATFQIDKRKLREGVSHLTIFNESGQAVSERLYFKRPTKQLQIAANTALPAYSTRKKVEVAIAIKNEKNEPKYADVSVAVRRLDSLQGMDQNDIVSYLWLCAELKGNIESPNYYLTNNTKESNKALDNLLLTQGWRKFIWEEMLKTRPAVPQFLPEFNGHLISGLLKGTDGLPKKYTQVYLSVPGTRLQFYNTVSDSAGHFVFNTKDFYDANEILVQTNVTVDSTSLITVSSPFSEQYNKFGYQDFNQKLLPLQNLQMHSFGMQVQNAYSANQLKQFYAPAIDSSKFYGKPDKTYIIKDYTKFETIEEVLREYVSEALVAKRQKNFHIKIASNYVVLDEDPLVLLDGVPYFNFDKLMMMNPSKVEKLEVVRNKYYYQSAAFEGILDFSSFKSNLTDIEINPNSVVLDYEGMQLQRVFYTPVYETPAQINSRIPDFRNVLYWSPNLPIDAQGKGSLHFFTSDFPGTYIVTLQGLSADGVPGSKSFQFEVKK